MGAGVYIIENKANGHRYVGSAVNLKNRLADHLRCLRLGKHHSRYLQHAWNKYGEGAFTFEVLEEWEQEFLVGMEQWWMNMLRPEYNVEPVAKSSLGVRHTLETRARNRAANLGRKYSDEIRAAKKVRMNDPETKAKLAAAQKGRKYGPETIVKHRVAMLGNQYTLGYQPTPETRRKLSNAQMNRTHDTRTSQATKMIGNKWNLGYKHSPEARARMSVAAKLSWARRREEG